MTASRKDEPHGETPPSERVEHHAPTPVPERPQAATQPRVRVELNVRHGADRQPTAERLVPLPAASADGRTMPAKRVGRAGRNITGTAKLIEPEPVVPTPRAPAVVEPVATPARHDWTLYVLPAIALIAVIAAAIVWMLPPRATPATPAATTMPSGRNR